jgi:hypothetical protein
MAEADLSSRLKNFPAPACRCGSDEHEPNCLKGLLAAAATDIDTLRAENTRLRAMTLVASPTAQAKGAERNLWVRLMCFYGISGVWNSDDEKADVAGLALPPAVKAEIVAWKHSLDHVESVTPADIEAFSTRALNVARKIKEAAPDWKVVYIDRTKSGADIRNKDYFEHEVTL